MKNYRIHCVDEHNKRVATHEVMLADDLAALDKANELCLENAVEVWDGDRRVVWMKKGGDPLYESVLAAIAPPNARSAQNQLDAGKA